MKEHQEQTLALLRLSLCPGAGTAKLRALVDHFGAPQGVLDAPEDELQQVEGVSSRLAGKLRRGPADADVQRELDLMERYRVRLVPYFSDNYPPPLRHLDDGAPVLLRIRGEYQRKDHLAIAVVGSRHCTVYGREQASRIAADLCSMGFTVVSGMAYGIDSSAHRGALLAKGRTLAVLGCGLAHGLSGDDRDLAVEIAGSGALLSELPMEAPPLAGNFPPRNRIISGLSLGVVVVEAAARSGSLITARLAGEQGRAVFAVPGNVNSPQSRGANQLIRDGAVLVESARDIVEGLGSLSEPLELPSCAEDEAPLRLDDARVMALNPRERQIYEMLGAEPRHIDEVITEAELAPSIVSSTLLTLEIRGLVRRLPGQLYARPSAPRRRP